MIVRPRCLLFLLIYFSDNLSYKKKSTLLIQRLLLEKRSFFHVILCKMINSYSQFSSLIIHIKKILLISFFA